MDNKHLTITIYNTDILVVKSLTTGQTIQMLTLLHTVLSLRTQNPLEGKNISFYTWNQAIISRIV